MPAERERLVLEIRRSLDAMMRAGPPGGHGGPWMELDLTIGQIKVIFCLAGPSPLSMSALAQQLGITLPAATYVVDRLVRAGLVARQEHPSDRRFVDCFLTAQGQALVQRIRQSGPLESDECFELMTVAELRIMAKAFAIFNRVLATLREDHTQGEREITPV